MEDIRLWMWFMLAMGGHKALARKLYEKSGSVKKIYECTRSDYREMEVTSEQKIEALSNKCVRRNQRNCFLFLSLANP